MGDHLRKLYWLLDDIKPHPLPSYNQQPERRPRYYRMVDVMDDAMDLDEPRGTKRKAPEAPESTLQERAPRRIKASLLHTPIAQNDHLDNCANLYLSGPGSRCSEQDCGGRDHRGTGACSKGVDRERCRCRLDLIGDIGEGRWIEATTNHRQWSRNWREYSAQNSSTTGINKLMLGRKRICLFYVKDSLHLNSKNLRT